MAEALASDGQTARRAESVLKETTDLSKRKKKVALYVAYLGAGYAGMQANPGQKTIESELESAIHKAGGISDANAGSFSKVDIPYSSWSAARLVTHARNWVKWARSARTDKGVSAVGQVVSLKMLVGDPNLVPAINSHLPAQIRVLGYTEATGQFDARLLCDKRRYEYILPASAFADDAGSGAQPRSREGDYPSASISFDKEKQDRLNGLLSQYQGTHHFHNFTVKVAASDPSSKRYILNFECPGTLEIQGEVWVKMVVLGQSFMLHQIRKMVGLAVAIMRGVAPRNAIWAGLDPQRVVNTPIAPDVGLFLHESIFESYNSKWADRGLKIGFVGLEKEIADFKEKVLYPHIAERDRKESCTKDWIVKMEEFREHYREVYNSNEKEEPNLKRNRDNLSGSAEEGASVKRAEVEVTGN